MQTIKQNLAEAFQELVDVFHFPGEKSKEPAMKLALDLLGVDPHEFLAALPSKQLNETATNNSLLMFFEQNDFLTQ